MSLEQRAKIFTPFDPLDGFSAALRAVEEQAELAREQDEARGASGLWPAK